MAALVLAPALVAVAVWLLDRPRRRARERFLALRRDDRLSSPSRRTAARGRESTILQFVDAVVAELDAGAPPTGAVQVAAAALGHDPVLAALARHAALGGDVVAALHRAADAPRAGALRKVAACLQVTAQSGAGLGTALRRVSDGVRDELALSREVAGQLAAPRATAKLLAGLPFMVWLMGYGLGADPLRVLLTTPYGWACVVVGVGLEVLGLVWVERQARAVTARVTAEGDRRVREDRCSS